MFFECEEQFCLVGYVLGFWLSVPWKDCQCSHCEAARHAQQETAREWERVCTDLGGEG
jgi:hypothetical protein